MTTKLRVGDAVKRTDIPLVPGIVTMQGVIEKINTTNTHAWVRFYENTWVFNTEPSGPLTKVAMEHLELYQCGLKVGDRVRLIEDPPGGESSLRAAQRKHKELRPENIGTVVGIDVRIRATKAVKLSKGTDFDHFRVRYPSGDEVRHTHSGDWLRIDEV